MNDEKLKLAWITSPLLASIKLANPKFYHIE